jgi:O-antigen ligase
VLNKTLLPLQFGGITGLNINNIVLYLSVIILAVTDVAFGRIRKKQIPGLKLIIITIGCLLASIVYAKLSGYMSEPTIYVVQLFKRLYLNPFLLYILAFLFIDSKKDAQRCLVTIVVLFSLLNITSLILLHFDIQFFIVQEHSQKYSQESGRFVGVIGNPNKTSKWQKIFFSVVALLTILTVVLSGSRGGILTLLFVIIATLITAKRHISLLIFLVAVFIGFFFALKSPVGVTIFERMQPLLEGDLTAGTSGRLAIWGALLNVYVSNISIVLFGLGLGASEMVGMRADPHNYYLQILAEFGLVGFLVFFCFVAWYVRFIWILPASDNLHFRTSLFHAVSVIGIAWLFSSLDGIMNFVCLTVGVSMAYLLYLQDSLNNISGAQ